MESESVIGSLVTAMSGFQLVERFGSDRTNREQSQKPPGNTDRFSHIESGTEKALPASSTSATSQTIWTFTSPMTCPI